ncbi:MAG: RNB domain-containing ribonuclease [Planctomycetes bacterium]|nr:RNB domain-containing ribonuclease [Planctomycetota bacterium]
MNLEKKILDYFGKLKNKEANLKKVVSAMEGDEFEVSNALRSLEGQGLVVSGDKDIFVLVDSSNLIPGTVYRNRRGRMMFRPDDRSVPLHHLTDKSTDYVNPGDYVLVKPVPEKKQKVQSRRRGVNQIGPEHTCEFFKTIRKRQSAVLGVVETARNGYKQLVTFGRNESRYVKLYKKDAIHLNEGQVLSIDNVITIPGTNDVFAEEVSEIGDIFNPEDDYQIIKSLYSIDDEFPEDAIKQSKSYSLVFDSSGRLDLRNEMLITIDPPDAKDFDDAASIKRTKNGFILGVHIADVSFYVPPESPVDICASTRGNTFYLSDKTVPMIPHELSSDLCSLRENEMRYTKTVNMEFDKYGNLLDYSIRRSIIKSARRFTYEEVQSLYDGVPAEKLGIVERMAQMLRDMRELALILRKRREENGSLNMRIKKYRAVVDENFDFVEMREDRQNLSNNVIEEFALAANSVVSKFLQDNNLPIVSRLHNLPSAEDITNLFIYLAELGYGGSRDIWRLHDVIRFAEGRDNEGHIMLALLRSLSQAEYASTPGKHFALNFDYYTHFTSPIRRYADLLVHQVLDDYFDGAMTQERFAFHQSRIDRALAAMNFQERQAERAERELSKIKVIRHLQDQVGLEHSGTVSGFGFGCIYVEIDDYGIDGFVPVNELRNKKALKNKFMAMFHTRRGITQYMVGDHVDVRFEKVSLVRREIELALL